MLTTARKHDLTANAICTSKFTIDVKKKTFTAFASDLGPAREGTPWLQQMYPDAMDLAICLHSARTGRFVDFLLVNVAINRYDLKFWKFRGAGPYADWTVTIYND